MSANGNGGTGAQAAPAGAELELRLYVAGHSRHSVAALSLLRDLCETELAGRCRLDVVDLVEEPQRAREDGIVAVPTLVRRAPGPPVRVIGDLSDAARIRDALEITGDG